MASCIRVHALIYPVSLGRITDEFATLLPNMFNMLRFTILAITIVQYE